MPQKRRSEDAHLEESPKTPRTRFRQQLAGGLGYVDAPIVKTIYLRRLLYHVKRWIGKSNKALMDDRMAMTMLRDEVTTQMFEVNRAFMPSLNQFIPSGQDILLAMGLDRYTGRVCSMRVRRPNS